MSRICLNKLSYSIWCFTVIFCLAVSSNAAEYKEAPQFAELVKSGELPPLEERLPENPLVVQPHAEIGQYGGTWRMGLRGGGDTALLIRTIGYEQLMRWDVDFTTPMPNIAERVEVSDDATTFTFKLRKGMKWSDGEPFTADDIMYCYELITDPEITPSFPKWLMAGGEPVTMAKIDDYTVTFTFAEPNGLFIYNLAHPNASLPTDFPKHFVSQFDRKYNPEAEKLAKEMGFETPVALLQAMAGGNARWRYQFPTLGAWRLTAPYKGDTTLLAAERNPYYWKVDPEGHQLPYIDKVTYGVGEDVETLVLKVVAGEIDMQDRHIDRDVNKAVFFDSKEQGNYRFYEKSSVRANTVAISLNMTHTDPVKREIFQNKDFRIGLSHAINRREIIDLVSVGQGEPHQVAPLPGSPFYNERLATQYLEYNVDLANEYLDKAGYTERDADGFRLGPDGKRISIIIEAASSMRIDVDTSELVVNYWKEVGIDTFLKVEDRSIFEARRQNNEHDAVAFVAPGGAGMEIILNAVYFFPFAGHSNYAPLWQKWYNDQEGGEEPTVVAKKQMELYDQLKMSADTEKQVALMKEILEIAADQFYAIGISTPAPSFGIVKNTMHNVPDAMINSWLYPNPAPTNPEQYFYK